MPAAFGVVSMLGKNLPTEQRCSGVNVGLTGWSHRKRRQEQKPRDQAGGNKAATDFPGIHQKSHLGLERVVRGNERSLPVYPHSMHLFNSRCNNPRHPPRQRTRRSRSCRAAGTTSARPSHGFAPTALLRANHTGSNPARKIGHCPEKMPKKKASEDILGAKSWTGNRESPNCATVAGYQRRRNRSESRFRTWNFYRITLSKPWSPIRSGRG